MSEDTVVQETTKTEEIETINIISMANDAVIGISSFNKNEAGEAEAKSLFVTLLKSYGDNLTEEEIEEFVAEGYYEQGTHQIFLAKS